MKIKNLAKREKADLEMICLVVQEEVERAVSKIRDENFHFYSLQKNELFRLLRFRAWEEIYQVDILYILTRLLPFWSKWIPARTRKAKVGQGLGVRISTLTGKKSEQMLIEFIKQDFPSGQNKTLHRSWMQSVILDREMETPSEDGIKVKTVKDKNLFDFPHPRGYVQYYERRIRKQHQKREHIIQEMKARPFRGNPFVSTPF